MSTKILVVGLDCAGPHLVFDRYADAMPHLTALRRRGLSGKLRSVAPPITVPAWACMTTGLDPGELGLYGFRLRTKGSYALRVATGNDVTQKRVWDRLGENGRTVAPLFVPPSVPPPAVRGVSAGCFLTPPGAPWTFPRGIAQELETRFGPYRADVDDFRTDDLPRIRASLLEAVDQHFAIAAHLLREKRPYFAMMVEIAIDRLHHAFYRHIDPAHPEFDPSSPHASVGEEVYGRADRRLGELLAIVGDECDVLVVSDHGARPLRGGFCINDFLIARGDLVLRERPSGPTPFDVDSVDWSRTRAWAEGGYYGRVFVNLRGREPLGIVDDRDAYLAELERAFRQADLGSAGSLACRVDRPELVYRASRGLPPDLMVYAGDLDFRAIGSVGHDSLLVPTNDRGPDSCNHDWDGIAVLSGPSFESGPLHGASLLDVTPTLLALAGVASPGLAGRDLRRPGT